MNSSENNVLIEAIKKSALKAFDEHYKLTDGEWLTHTPEYWYTSFIAQGIKKAFPKYSIYLENSVAEVRSSAQPKKGRPSKRLASGKCDISIWKYWKTRDENNCWEAKTIIEIKRAWSWDNSTLGDDIKRLRSALFETQKINNTFFVVMSDEQDTDKETAKQLLKNRFHYFHDKIQKYLENDSIRVDPFFKISKKYKEDESNAGIFIYKLTADNRKGKNAK